MNKAGEIDPNTNDNIPGLEALDHADLMVILCRFRTLPDAQMKHIVDYLESGRPVIGMRTATHSFSYNGKVESPYKKYGSTTKTPPLKGALAGKCWAKPGSPTTPPMAKPARAALFAPGAVERPHSSRNQGWRNLGNHRRLWGPPPAASQLQDPALGQVIEGGKPEGKRLRETKPSTTIPCIPVAWTRTYSLTEGKTGRVFTTTMGSAGDLQNEAFRRLMVNATYWAVGLEDKIPEKANVEFVGSRCLSRRG